MICDFRATQVWLPLNQKLQWFAVTKKRKFIEANTHHQENYGPLNSDQAERALHFGKEVRIH